MIVCIVACAVIALAAGDNLQYWLERATPATSQAGAESDTAVPASAPATQPAEAPPRHAAWPGVVELSDGRVLAGMCHTTAGRPWLVYVEAEKRWRRVPPIAALGIAAVVREESYEQEWRWGAMGRPEKVFTGRRYPFRRYQWTFRLADGSEITGTVKGQPFWVECEGKQVGPLVLHERDKGPAGTTLEQLIYVKRVIVSRRAMEQALSSQSQRASRPGSD